MTLDPTQIKAAELNEEFGEFTDDGFPNFGSDSGLIQNLRMINQSDSEYKNLSFNFDMISLINGPQPLFNGDSVLFESGHSNQNYQQIFRVYDDVQIVGYLVDVWGLARTGMSSNGNMYDTNLTGMLPGTLTPLPDESSAVSFKVSVLGNYTNLDAELGYPAIYKSSEFNLVDDLVCTFSDAAGLAPFNNAKPNQLGENYLTNGEYEKGFATPGTQVEKKRPPRQVFYPVDEDKRGAFLHGGAEYIISITPFNEDDAVTLDASKTPAYHMLTALQVMLVCRCSRRRYS